jgi:sterol desaturase/sphingolipid hydroxylase (fatty acid hydroxylase superfamily)
MKHNHILHHLRKGARKGNFNVTLPGADYLFGTMYSNVEQE